MKYKKRVIIIISVIVAVMAVFLVWYEDIINIRLTAAVKTEQLDKLNLYKYNKLMIVAHPDDDLIWGGAHLIEDDYFVVCITNGNTSRKKEFHNMMKSTSDSGLILTFPDKIHGKRNSWLFCKDMIRRDIETIINYKDWDLIVTHNEEGEYGHKQHILTHGLVNSAYDNQKSKARLMYFGKYYKPSKVPSGLQSISEETLAKKDEIKKVYKSQRKTIKKFHHMFSYENWTER